MVSRAKKQEKHIYKKQKIILRLHQCDVVIGLTGRRSVHYSHELPDVSSGNVRVVEDEEFSPSALWPNRNDVG